MPNPVSPVTHLQIQTLRCANMVTPMTTEHARTARWEGDLLPHIVDRLARERPDAAYGLWPVESTSHDANLDSISYSQLANIINGLAWWIVERLGPNQNSEVLTYVGPNDVRLPQ
jgi:hypothetical protein